MSKKVKVVVNEFRKNQTCDCKVVNQHKNIIAHSIIVNAALGKYEFSFHQPINSSAYTQEDIQKLIIDELKNKYPQFGMYQIQYVKNEQGYDVYYDDAFFKLNQLHFIITFHSKMVVKLISRNHQLDASEINMLQRFIEKDYIAHRNQLMKLSLINQQDTSVTYVLKLLIQNQTIQNKVYRNEEDEIMVDINDEQLQMIDKIIHPKELTLLVKNHYLRTIKVKGKENMIDDKVKTKYERILNASRSSFLYYPNNVLSLVTSTSNNTNLSSVMRKALMNQEIGSFEIDMLSLIEQFTYLTKNMIIDLFVSGYISQGNRNMNRTILDRVMKRLNDYKLVNTLQIINKDTNKNVPMQIYAMDSNGNVLLKEVYRKHHYNVYELFQDCNVVKNRLAINQWMIYWLSNYPEQVRNNYFMNQLIRTLGAEKNGIRVYAAFTYNKKMVIGEGIRRVSDYDKEVRNQEILEKFGRFMNVFEDAGQMFIVQGYKNIPYDKADEVVICYICEDEEHMQELYDLLKEKMKQYPHRKVWFTCDLKLFNYNEVNQRFMQVVDDKWKVVDLKQELTLEDELLINLLD